MQQDTTLLNEVKSHLEHWRTTRTKKGERIPDHLWDKPKILIGQSFLRHSLL
jgi:hypothetical protein